MVQKDQKINLLWEIIYTFQPGSGSVHRQAFINGLPCPQGYMKGEMR